MVLHKNEILLSKSDRPFWHFIVALVFYIGAVGLVVYPLYMVNTYPEGSIREKDLSGFITIALFAFIIALGFSVVKTRYLNLEKEKLQTEFRLAFLKMKIYSSMPHLEYVSVFNNIGAEQFEVNLWYEGNHHFNIMDFEDAQHALDYGRLFSDKLNLKLLDATVKGNSKWIDKTIE